MADDRSSRNRFYDAGWRQGAVFTLPGVEVVSARLEMIDDEIICKQRSLKEKERLLLISHDCDLANAGFEYAECLICTEYDTSTKKWLKEYSGLTPLDPRKFVVDFKQGIVANVRDRVMIQKDILLALGELVFSIDDTPHFGRFRDWLAIRYVRENLNDNFHRSVFLPLRLALQKLRDVEPDTIAILSKVVKSIRFRTEDQSEIRLKVGLLLIVDNSEVEIDDEKLGYILRLEELIVGVLNSSSGVEFLGAEIKLYSEVKFVDMLNTYSFPADEDSYSEGLELIGAAPPPRVV